MQILKLEFEHDQLSLPAASNESFSDHIVEFT